MQNFGQSGPKNCVFLPIACSKFAPKYSPNCTISVCKNTKFPSFWGEHIPFRHPPVPASSQLAPAFHQIIPPCQRRIYAPERKCEHILSEKKHLLTNHAVYKFGCVIWYTGCWQSAQNNLFVCDNLVPYYYSFSLGVYLKI